jgi:hypothetical protein
LRQFWQSLRQEASISVALIGSFCCKLTAISCSLFGSLLIQYNYDQEYGPDRKKEAEADAKQLISLLFLIENVI